MPTTLTTIPIVHQKHHKDIQFAKLPHLPSASTIAQYSPTSFDKALTSIFEQKIDLCCVLCDFSDPEADQSAKITKLETLSELDAIFTNPNCIGNLPKPIIDRYLGMLLTNIMRDFPPIPEKYLIYDDEPPLVEVNWPHLSIIYQQLLKFQNLCPTIFDNDFIAKFISRIHAPDVNEREQVLCFFTKYVISYPNKVSILMKKFAYILQGYSDRKYYPFAVTPILKFYLQQFPTLGKEAPLLLAIFKTSILPIISAQHILTFYSTLLSLIQLFISIDQSMAFKIIKKVMSYWPQSAPSKQTIFLSLINYLVENISLNEFEKLARPLFNLLANCAYSSHAKVVETSFLIWSNVKIIPMILDNTRVIFPIMYPAFSYVMKEHWNSSTQGSALNTLKSMHDIDPFIFDEITQNKRNPTAPPIKDRDALAHKNWAFIARSAAKTDRSVNLAKTLADIQMRFNKTTPDDNVSKAEAFRNSKKTQSGRIVAPSNMFYPGGGIH